MHIILKLLLLFEVFPWQVVKKRILFLLCRWRDVKMRAFDNADHRTYVDLKVRSLSE